MSDTIELELKTVILEFIQKFGFKEIAVISPFKYRFKELRDLKAKDKHIDLIYFEKEIEKLDWQISFALGISDLVFCEELPKAITPQPNSYIVGRFVIDPFYIITGNWEFYEFAKMFMLEGIIL